MKKFIISLMIILIFAGVIYTIGLVTLFVPAGTWGVIETKTGGVEETVIKGGTWSWTWRWERIIPTMMTIHIFKPEIYKASLENPIKGQIFPSAREYATVLDGNPDFSFEAYYYIEFSVIPETFPDLVRKGIKPDNIISWSQDIAKQIGTQISRIILANPSLLFDKDFNQKIQAQLEDNPEFSPVKIEKLIPEKIQMPDYQLYLKAKENYLKIQDLKLQAQIKELSAKHDRNMLAMEKEMDIIKNIDKYGELLTKYPVLIQFLYMRNIKDEDFLKLSQFRISNSEDDSGNK